LTRLRRTIAASRRGTDGDCFAGLKHGRVAAFKFFDPAIVSADGVFADLSGFAARGPEWGYAQVTRQGSSPVLRAGAKRSITEFSVKNET
jgi:hypothetical protein